MNSVKNFDYQILIKTKIENGKKKRSEAEKVKEKERGKNYDNVF